MMRFVCIAVLLVITLAACGSNAGNVATNPPPNSASASVGTPTAAQTGGVRTVLSPIGLNIRATDISSAPAVGSLAQGTVVTVTGHSDNNGGWYKIHGETVDGWITADSTLTAAGRFNIYQSDQRGFSVLYPDSWTFAEEPNDVVFRPQSGQLTIVVKVAGNLQAFGAAGKTGYSLVKSSSVEACGVTGTLVTYKSSGSASGLSQFAQVLLRLDSTHALSAEFNYNSDADFQYFHDFYDALTFPVQACRNTGTPPPAPTP
jgi:hypothetical protein